MKQFGDGVFMPLETPEARRHLEEMCEGKMIARCCWDVNEERPWGCAAFGLEFTTSERFVILAVPVTQGRFLARLIWRWVPAQSHWTRAMRRHFTADRRSAEEATPDFLQAQIEGQMIRGVRPARVDVGLGERMDFELRDGSIVVVEAMPTLGGPRPVTDLEVRRIDHRHHTVIQSGNSRGGR